ncbi:hypothetical protein TWF225_009328 [Orbilia oligospora]|nr:hypothetical protein TWF225_009328 [Orbilia oligospora]KAF3269966.1 hypothetical protein TWF217_008312 [Orbilia oligospora]KAF3270429.1 hypothetical protein TWF128_004204 [Orbilia oligospora]
MPPQLPPHSTAAWLSYSSPYQSSWHAGVWPQNYICPRTRKSTSKIPNYILLLILEREQYTIITTLTMKIFANTIPEDPSNSQTNTVCHLDAIPDEIHLDILYKIDSWKTHIAMGRAYPRWRRLIKDPAFKRIAHKARYSLDFPIHRLFTDGEAAHRILEFTIDHGKIESMRVSPTDLFSKLLKLDNASVEERGIWNIELGEAGGVLEDKFIDRDKGARQAKSQGSASGQQNHKRRLSVSQGNVKFEYSERDPYSSDLLTVTDVRLGFDQVSTIREMMETSVKSLYTGQGLVAYGRIRIYFEIQPLKPSLELVLRGLVERLNDPVVEAPAFNFGSYGCSFGS